MIQELDQVALTVDLPEHDLKQGDIGTVVLVHNHHAGFEVEFVSLDGETVAVVSLHTNEVRAFKPYEIAHARQMTAAD